jgi:hypothetical protein
MGRMRCAALALAALLVPLGAAAAPDSVGVRATYEAYALGMHVMEIEAAVQFGPDGYRLQLDYHTTGLYGLLVPGHWHAFALGGWLGGNAEPWRFEAVGRWRGEPRHTLIVWQGETPSVRIAEDSAEDNERQPLPPDALSGSLDPLSAMAEVIHRAEADDCRDSVHVLDGRRLSAVVAQNIGPAVLAPDEHSAFAGRGLRCDFDGHLLAGFRRDSDPDDAKRPLHGWVLLASPIAGAPPLPLRMSFETRWLGPMAIYLTAVTPTPLPPGGVGAER